MPEGFDLNNEPPIDPLDDTNPSTSQQMPAVNPDDEPPIRADDTNPSQAIRIDEPPIHADDTNPSMTVRQVDAPVPAWRRALGVASLLGAVLLTAGAVYLILVPPQSAPAPVADVPTQTTAPTQTTIPTDEPLPTDADTADAAENTDSVSALPTLSVEQSQSLLSQPISRAQSARVQIIRNPYAPFTTIPDRPRNEVIKYTVEQGDTIIGIAERFGITPEAVVWGNDRRIVEGLRPGLEINIVPENGVYIERHTGNTTIAEYAAQYRIDDPYDIIDSEYNPELRGLEPDDSPPSGTPIMIVGGVAEQISWTPVVERTSGGGSGSSSSGAGGVEMISFAPGEPGSCGRVENPGGGAFWSNPLASYTWMRGFTSYHTGVDLAANVGTPVLAANTGRVIFAGWNSYGYGNTVVLAHGPFTTLYGHMNSITVGCGQSVSAGAQVGAVGNTGNSSGSHLHFEIRYNDQPQDPTLTIGF